MKKELVTRQEALPQDREVGTLARELATAYRTSVDYHKRRMGLPPAEAVAKAEEPMPEGYHERVLAGPADQVSWSDLEMLTRKDPDLAAGRWERMLEEAREELRSGHRAARAMEGYTSDAWQRARFLAIREELAEEWQPRNGIERQLIDAMAQAQTSAYFWQERLALRASVEPLREKRAIEESGGWDLPRVSEHQAVEQAGAMVDRFNRMFLRTLRALRDLRRYSPTVIVQNAGQVNVGAQQVNVTPSRE